MSPAAAFRPCRWPGCPALLRSGRFCPAHAAEYERQRGSAAARGYGADHRAWRADVLRRFPTCVDPDGRHPGELRPAVVADHILPLTRGGTWDLDNGQGLCVPCHNAKTATEKAARGPRN